MPSTRDAHHFQHCIGGFLIECNKIAAEYALMDLIELLRQFAINFLTFLNKSNNKSKGNTNRMHDMTAIEAIDGHFSKKRTQPKYWHSIFEYRQVEL